jgi:hypothetical protein
LEERLEERLAEDHNSQAKEVVLLCIGRRISSDGRCRRDDTDWARRFITLIDELYEAGCCLACTAADVPDRLFVGKAVDDDSDNSDGDDGNNDPSNNCTEDDVGAGTSSELKAL